MDKVSSDLLEIVPEAVTNRDIINAFTNMLIYSTDYSNRDPFDYRASMVREASQRYGIPEEELWESFNNRVEEYIKTKVQDYSDPKLNTYKKITARSTLASQLRIFIPSTQDIKQILDYFERESTKPIIVDTKEFLSLAKVKDDKNYIVESLLHKRMFLFLVAYAKVGKTMFAYNLLVSVVTGQDWLNRKVNVTKALFIQNEEGLTEASKKVYSNRIGQFELDNPDLFNQLVEENRILVMKDVDIVEDMQLIFDYIEKEGVGLVIIDSLSASLKKCGLSELSPELPALLYKFQALVHKYEICCILLHHTTKMENNESQTDRLKGAGGRSGLVRANDGMITLTPVTEKKVVDPSQLQVFFDLRHGSPFSIKILRTEEEANQWQWVVKEETMLSPENIQTQNAILRLLYERYTEWTEYLTEYPEDEDTPIFGKTLYELITELGMTKETILPRLNWMSRSQGIEIYKDTDSKKYVYHYPESGESWLYKYVEDEEKFMEEAKLLEEEDNRVREAIVACVNYEQISEIVHDYSKEDKERIFAGLSKADQARIKLLKYPPKYAVGSYVFYNGIVHTVKSVEFSKTPVDVPLDERRIYTLSDMEEIISEKFLESVPITGVEE